MIRFQYLMAAALLLLAPPAIAQDLRSGLDAIKRGQWESALRELRPLAEADNAEAQYAVGTLYANGDGVARDMAQAEKYWRQAAQKGHARAREQLTFLRVMAVEAAAARTATAPSDGWRIQLATVPSIDSAPREFRRLTRQFNEILAGMEMVAPVFTMPDGAQVVRVQAGPLSEERARETCAKLRDLNAGCRVIRPDS